MSLKMRLHGARQLDKVLKKLPEKIRRRVLNAAVMAGGEIIRKEAKARAPVRAGSAVKKLSETTGRKPGVLRASIVKKRPRGTLGVVEVGPSNKGFYGIYQEFGTKNQKARPFLGPAFEAKKRAALAKIGQSLKKGIEREAAKLAGPYSKSGLKSKRRR